MRRPGSDENDLQMRDFLCDYCGREWTELVPMVEGHRGSCICGNCVGAAYAALEIEGAGSATPPFECALCLERRTEPGWASPVREGVCACRRCVKQSAGVLSQDKESGWKRPGGG